jgi:uncharacterized membrane protein (GlpM family)
MPAKTTQRTKRVQRVNIARDEAMIAHTDVAVYVRRRGKQVRTSCLFGMEMLCAYIESIETASHLAMIRREANFAEKRMKSR